MSPETFVGHIEEHQTPNIAAYVAHGGSVSTAIEPARTLLRLRYMERQGGVQTELLATLHARIIDRETESDGCCYLTVAGQGRWGRSFAFRIRECDFWNSRKFSAAVARSAGPGTYIVPGKVAATMRAIEQLSRGSPTIDF